MVSGFYATKYNPEKSKHLETASIKIKGQEIDFVNLRGESYNEESRIPEIVGLFFYLTFRQSEPLRRTPTEEI